MSTISDETFSQQELVMENNQKISEVLKVADVGHFKWNCMQVTTTKMARLGESL